MTPILPPSRPDATRDEVLSFITDGVPLPAFPFLVGRRGYYGDSMGAAGANDINVYDDAFFIVEADCCTAFNGNCDPGRHRPGMANLNVGRWCYRPGIHNITKDPELHPHYPAFVQAEKVTVTRDGKGEDTGFFGINIHRGGNGVTSSEGCQTVPPGQWNDFFATMSRALNRAGAPQFVYILTSRY
jgi:hypothetical protein